MRARGRRRVGRDQIVIAIVAFALAFALRLVWTLHVQRPINAVYSDMAGYVLRAEQLLAHTVPGEPRTLVLWPWGTHVLVAAEIYLFGRQSVVGIGLCHALVGAVGAPCASLLASRIVAGRILPLLVGITVATWNPLVVMTGYFLSENWFTAAIVAGSFFFVRHTEGRRGALAAGVCAAIAFAVRPQVLLTFALVGAAWIASRLRGKLLFSTTRWGAAALVVPLAVTLAGSSIRVHRWTGHWGLNSINEPLQLLFAETDVARVEASWTTASGERWAWWFQSIPRSLGGGATETNTVHIEGFISDRTLLDRERVARVAKESLANRTLRRLDNAVLLVAKNLPWPENQAPRGWRRAWQRNCGYVIFGLLALAALGWRSMQRHPLLALVVKAQLLTILFVGARYLGEARYRIPYDPFLILVAAAGLARLVAAVRARWGSRHAAEAQPAARSSFR